MSTLPDKSLCTCIVPRTDDCSLLSALSTNTIVHILRLCHSFDPYKLVGVRSTLRWSTKQAVHLLYLFSFYARCHVVFSLFSFLSCKDETPAGHRTASQGASQYLRRSGPYTPWPDILPTMLRLSDHTPRPTYLFSRHINPQYCCLLT